MQDCERYCYLARKKFLYAFWSKLRITFPSYIIIALLESGVYLIECNLFLPLYSHTKKSHIHAYWITKVTTFFLYMCNLKRFLEPNFEMFQTKLHFFRQWFFFVHNIFQKHAGKKYLLYIIYIWKIKLRPKKKYVCLLSHVKKIYGRLVGIIYYFIFLLSAKPEIVVPEYDSGISFSISRHLLKLFYDELHSFSTFFALNFEKKLAVE